MKIKNSIRVILGISLICCLFTFTAIAQNRGATIASHSLDTASANFNRRFALVIGNAAYPNNKLNNPVNDARDMSVLLEKYGFRVLLDTNVSRLQMNRDVNSFGDSILNNKGVGLFYFSGHGLQYNGKNYLLPLDYELKTASDIEDESVPMSKVFEKLSAFKNGRNFVILDACRNNPFYEANPNFPKGLNDNGYHPSNAILFLSTLGGSVAADGSGSNSPFTESLVSTIKEKDSIEFFQVVKTVVRDVKMKSHEQQVPDIIGAPDMDFYFRKNPDKGKPNLFILSVGIARYRDETKDLLYSVKDAFDFANVFRQQYNGGENLYKQVYNYTLTNEFATKFNLESSISKIKERAKDGDVILVFFSGHVLADNLGKTYYMPSDGDFNHPGQTGLYSGEIVSLLSDMPCKSLLFLDGCTGDIDKQTVLPIGKSISEKPILHELVSPGNNVVVFLAARSGEFAYERTQVNNGLFVSGIIKAMKNADSKAHSGYVDVEALATFVEEYVPKISEGLQHPKVIFPKGWQNFILFKKP